MTPPRARPKPADAGPELLVLQKWEAFAAWFFNHTARWPKAARFTLTHRLENHTLDVTEMLVEARYEPALRARRLHEVNLRLERMRFLCRLARDARVQPPKGFASTMRQVDEVGRMLHGWRKAFGARPGKQVSA